MVLVKKLDPEPVSCPDCKKILKSKEILKKHWRKVHVSAPGSICGVVVKNMGLHMGERHKPNSEKKFHCSDCMNGFMTIQKLETHRMSVHLKSMPTSAGMAVTIGIMTAVTEMLMKGEDIKKSLKTYNKMYSNSTSHSSLHTAHYRVLLQSHTHYTPHTLCLPYALYIILSKNR